MWVEGISDCGRGEAAAWILVSTLTLRCFKTFPAAESQSKHCCLLQTFGDDSHLFFWGYCYWTSCCLSELWVHKRHFHLVPQSSHRVLCFERCWSEERTWDWVQFVFHGYFNENINTFLSAVTWTTIRQFANRCVSVEFPHHVWLTAGLSGSLLCCQVSWWSTGSPPLHTDYTVLNWKSQSCSEDLELWWCLQWSVKREVIITAQSGFQWLDVCPLLYWPCIKCSLPGPVGGVDGGDGGLWKQSSGNRLGTFVWLLAVDDGVFTHEHCFIKATDQVIEVKVTLTVNSTVCQVTIKQYFM